MVYIVMGVSGCGKTTVGQLLAGRLGVPFFDADDYHPPFNIEKMKNGISLTDADRFPWLDILAALIRANKEKGMILACSALREKYREILMVAEINWVVLEGNFEQIYERMLLRKGHFMNTGLLRSQFAVYESPLYGLHLDVSSDPDILVNHILEHFN